MHAIEIASFGARVAGRITDRAALGTTLAQTIYTLSQLKINTKHAHIRCQITGSISGMPKYFPRSIKI